MTNWKAEHALIDYKLDEGDITSHQAWQYHRQADRLEQQEEEEGV